MPFNSSLYIYIYSAIFRAFMECQPLSRQYMDVLSSGFCYFLLYGFFANVEGKRNKRVHFTLDNKTTYKAAVTYNKRKIQADKVQLLKNYSNKKNKYKCKEQHLDEVNE